MRGYSTSKQKKINFCVFRFSFDIIQQVMHIFMQFLFIKGFGKLIRFNLAIWRKSQGGILSPIQSTLETESALLS